MRKKLLLTSSILTALPVVHAMGMGEGSKAPHLTISGSTTFHAAFVSQDVQSVGPGSTGSNAGQIGSGYTTTTVGKGQGFSFDIDDSFLDFSAKGKTDNGLDYMMRVNFDTVPGNSDGQNQFSAKKRVRQTYVQLHGMGFTLIGGSSSGVETTMTSDASNIMHGDGGFSSGWSTRFNEPAANGQTPTGNMVYGAYLAASTGTANKITLTTPRVFGFQLGYSFAPNSKHEGNLPPNNIADPNGNSPYTSNVSVSIPNSSIASALSASTILTHDTSATGTTITPANAYQFISATTSLSASGVSSVTGSITPAATSSYFDQNVSAFGLDFSETFGDFSVDLAGNFIAASQTKYSVDPGAGTSPYKTSSGWSTGLTLSYAGFDLSGGYFDNRNTGITFADAQNGADGGKVWNVGAAYTHGAFAVALGYLNGQKKLATYNSTNASSQNDVPQYVDVGSTKTKAQIYSLTLDYRLAEGLTTYIDANYAKMEDPSALSSGTSSVQTTTWAGQTGDQAKNKGAVVLIGTRITL